MLAGLATATSLLSACAPSQPAGSAWPSLAKPAPLVPPAPTTPAMPQRIFYSGHSLMDRPLPDRVEAIARGEGQPVQWDRQYRLGSLLRERAQPAAPGQSGWTNGDNREGSGLDVEAALSGRVSGLEPFDVLVVTERHDILWAMQNESTARHLRAMHDQRQQGRPQGRTWFYESWQSFSPERIAEWAAYERAAAGAWQCVAAEVNRSLQAEGRSDRVHSLPAARALALLVERATSPEGLPGVSAATPRATVERLFTDNVHLTEAGFHYMALVTWAFVNGKPASADPASPVPAPAGLDPALDRALRLAAAQAHAALQGETLAEAPAEACQARLQALCPVVWSYMATRFQADGQSWPGARWKQFKLQRQCEAGVRDGRHRLVAAGR